MCNEVFELKQSRATVHVLHSCWDHSWAVNLNKFHVRSHLFKLLFLKATTPLNTNWTQCVLYSNCRTILVLWFVYQQSIYFLLILAKRIWMWCNTWATPPFPLCLALWDNSIHQQTLKNQESSSMCDGTILNTLDSLTFPVWTHKNTFKTSLEMMPCVELGHHFSLIVLLPHRQICLLELYQILKSD